MGWRETCHAKRFARFRTDYKAGPIGWNSPAADDVLHRHPRYAPGIVANAAERRSFSRGRAIYCAKLPARRAGGESRRPATVRLIALLPYKMGDAFSPVKLMDVFSASRPSASDCQSTRTGFPRNHSVVQSATVFAHHCASFFEKNGARPIARRP